MDRMPSVAANDVCEGTKNLFVVQTSFSAVRCTTLLVLYLLASDVTVKDVRGSAPALALAAGITHHG